MFVLPCGCSSPSSFSCCAFRPSTSAATATAVFHEEEGYKGSDESYTQVIFQAAPGEANRLHITAGGTSARLVDDGATIDAGTGCTAVSAHEVSCVIGRFEALVSATLGDGDDAATVDATPGEPGALTRLAGGPGNDVLTSMSGGDLDGDDGDDRLTIRSGGDSNLEGGAGNDRLTGGDGSDRLDGGTGDDTIDGDGGEDVVWYAQRRVPVRVDLAAGRGGAAGETGTLLHVEDIEGGTAGGTLLGDDGPNRIGGSFDVARGGVSNAGPGAIAYATRVRWTWCRPAARPSASAGRT